MNIENLHEKIWTDSTEINAEAVKGKVNLISKNYADLRRIERGDNFFYRQSQRFVDGIERINCYAAFLFWWLPILKVSPTRADWYLSHLEGFRAAFAGLNERQRRLTFGNWLDGVCRLYGELIAFAVSGRIDAVRMSAVKLAAHLQEEFV